MPGELWDGRGCRRTSYTPLSLSQGNSLWPSAPVPQPLLTRLAQAAPRGSLQPAGWGAEQGGHLQSPVTRLGSGPSQGLSFPMHKTAGLGTKTFPVSFHSKPR